MRDYRLQDYLWTRAEKDRGSEAPTDGLHDHGESVSAGVICPGGLLDSTFVCSLWWVAATSGR